MYTLHRHCRACGYARVTTAPGIKSAAPPQSLTPVFDLGLQPPANDFHTNTCQGFAPLQVLLCPRCNLAQLSVVVDPVILYSHYSYRTSPSQTMQDHFASLKEMLQKETGGYESVVEIGSNDGSLLKFLGAPKSCGIDPAENLANIANLNGIHTVRAVFDFDSVRNVLNYVQSPADVILARHVFCHLDDWSGFLSNLEHLCNFDTLIAIEVPWVHDLLANTEFDTIHFEHLSYLSIRAMLALLDKSTFLLEKVLYYPIHGGALMLLLRPKIIGREPDRSVAEFLDRELCGEKEWSEFDYKTFHRINVLRELVWKLRGEGKTVAALGASAKSSVLFNACGFNQKQIAFIADCTPEKQWKLAPGTEIPVVDEWAVLRDMPDYCVMTAWNFRDEILAKHARYRKQGGKFIIPIPNLEIV